MNQNSGATLQAYSGDAFSCRHLQHLSGYVQNVGTNDWKIYVKHLIEGEEQIYYKKKNPQTICCPVKIQVLNQSIFVEPNSILYNQILEKLLSFKACSRS